MIELPRGTYLGKQLGDPIARKRSVRGRVTLADDARAAANG
jgi:hypothetical protein